MIAHSFMVEKHNTFPHLESSQLFSGQENYPKPTITKIKKSTDSYKLYFVFNPQQAKGILINWQLEVK